MLKAASEVVSRLVTVALVEFVPTSRPDATGMMM